MLVFSPQTAEARAWGVLRWEHVQWGSVPTGQIRLRNRLLLRISLHGFLGWLSRLPKFYLYFVTVSFHLVFIVNQLQGFFLKACSPLLPIRCGAQGCSCCLNSLTQHKVQAKQSVIWSLSCNRDFLLMKRGMTSSRQCNSSFTTSWQFAQMFRTVKIKILFQNATSFSRITEVLQASTAAAEGLLSPQGLGTLSTEDSRSHRLSHVTLSGSGTGKGGKASPGFRNTTLLCKSSKRLPQLDTYLWKAHIEKITICFKWWISSCCAKVSYAISNHPKAAK